MVQLQVQGVVKAAVAASADGAVLLHQDGKHLVAGEFGAGRFGETEFGLEIRQGGFVVVVPHRRLGGIKNGAAAGQVVAALNIKADFAQTLQNGLVGFVPYVNAHPLAAQHFGGNRRGGAAAERVQHPVAGVAAGGDDTLVQLERLLRGVARAFPRIRRQGRDVLPNGVQRVAFHFVKVTLLPGQPG